MRRACVVCLLPVRNAASALPSYLAAAARFADAVIALDDGSTDDTRAVLRASPLVRILLTNPRRSDARGWNDGANRARLLRAAGALEPDWIVFLDADERIDAGDARALRAFLRRDGLPGCAYGLQHYRMWGHGAYVPDVRWIYRVFAFARAQRLPRRRLHFNPIPADIPRRAWLRTTIRVQHFGAATRGAIASRRAKYAAADPGRRYGHGPRELDRAPDGPVARWRPRPRSLPVLLDEVRRQ